MYPTVPLAPTSDMVLFSVAQFSQTKIWDFWTEILVQEDILWFYIKMKDLFITAFVQVLQAMCNVNCNMLNSFPSKGGNFV